MRPRILALALLAAVLAAGCSSTSGSSDEVVTDPPFRIVETHRVAPINSGR